MTGVRISRRLALGLGLPDNEQALEMLKGELTSTDNPSTRKRLNLGLEALQSKRPAEVLAKGLPDPATRMSAAIALSRLGPAGLNQLTLALRSEDKEVRSIAMEYLAYYYTHYWQYGITRKQSGIDLAPAIPEIIRLLREDIKSLRIEATDALGTIADERAVDPLIRISVNRDEDVDVRCGTIWTLGRIPDMRAIAPLLDLLSDSHKSIRIAATTALGYLLSLRSAYYPSSERQEAEKAREVGRLAATQALEPLIALLEDPNAEVRKEAVRTLGNLGDTRAIEVLLDLVNEHTALHHEALQSLGESKETRVIETLAKVLRTPDEAIETRMEAASGLGRYGESKAVEPLLAALNDPNEGIRVKVIDSLGAVGDRRAVEPLIHILKDQQESKRIRYSAVDALWRLRDKRAFEPLADLLTDSDLRAEAIWALGFLRDKRAVELLLPFLSSAEGYLRDRAATSLGLLGDSRAVEPLIHMLLHDEVDKRADAARALGRIGDPKALEALTWVRKHDAEICCGTYEARDAAAIAIKNIKRRKKNQSLLRG